MRAELEYLAGNTEFKYNGQRYKKGFTYGPNPDRKDPKDYRQGVLCEPFLGGQFQSSSKLRVWIPFNAQVDVS